MALLRQRVAAVAAANRHTVALVEGGHAYSWGSNLQGQLGYGTSDSASNAVPRIVEAMKVSWRAWTPSSSLPAQISFQIALVACPSPVFLWASACELGAC